VGLQLDLDGVWHARATSLWPLHEAELEANEGEASVAWTGFTAALARSLPLPIHGSRRPRSALDCS
jgi:hypothetical protein